MKKVMLVCGVLGTMGLGCGGDGRPPTEPEPVVARVDVAPGTDTLSALGQTRQYTAVARDAAGNVIPGKSFSWSSSAAAVASVDPATGLVTAVANGDATIRAMVDGVTGQAALAVAQQIATVSVTPASASLTAIGATQQFGAEARDGNNNLVAGVTFLWLSSDHNVATVSTSGLVTATGPGSATITAAGRGIPGNATLGVAQTMTQLAFSVQPTSAVAGEALSPAVQVEIRDASGAVVTAARDAVTLAIGTNPGNGALSGTKTVNAVHGIATFSGLWINKVGTGYTLAASSGTLTTTSGPFEIAHGPPTRLAFTAQPPAVVGVNLAVAPAVAVTIQDAFGNVVPTGTVALAIGTNPGGAALTGTLTAAAINGVATFADLQFDRTGLGYTLVAGMDGVTGQSTFFDVFAWSAVSASIGSHTCGIITPAGAAYCWGDNKFGQLGDGTNAGRARPVPVSGALRFALVSAGARHTCGVTTAGTAYCWGDNAKGQLGTGSISPEETPAPVSGDLHFGSVSAGGSHTCGVTLTQEAFCWGDDVRVPTLVKIPDGLGGNLGLTEVSVGLKHTCGRAIGDPRVAGVYCWDNAFGVPRAVQSNLQPFRGAPLSAGGGHTCAMLGQEAFCWGDNSAGQLGDGSTTDHVEPQFSVRDPVTKTTPLFLDVVSAGGLHSCGVTAGGIAYCWGSNGGGQLGDGTTSGRLLPVRVLEPKTATGLFSLTGISAGDKHTCAVTTLGVAYCWGFNGSGQLGDGTTMDGTVPARVATP